MFDIDEKKTDDKVKALLKQYDSICRLAGPQHEQRLTADYSLQPKGSGGIGRPVGNLVTRKVSAIEVLDNIYKTLNELDREQRSMLWNHYVLKNVNEYVIESEFLMSKPTYYKYLKMARIDFAYAYNNGELMVEPE